MAIAARKREPEPALKMFRATVLVTRAEEWCVEADTAEEARELLAQGEGHRCHFGDRLHAEVQELEEKNRSRGQPVPPRTFMDRRRTQPGRRMGRRKMPLATQQVRCRNTLHHWKNFCATLSKVGRIPRWLSRWASAGSSAVSADIRTIGRARPLPEVARWAWMAG